MAKHKVHYDLELDLDKIERLGRQREVENFRFRIYLKGKKSSKIDAIVHRLNDEISARIDCTTCGNCCARQKAGIKDEDVSRLSNRLGISKEDIQNIFIESDQEGYKFFRHIPCVFLKDKKCSIYKDRPGDCRSYPYLHREGFIFRLFGVIENYSVCPIVFNVFERLKTELNYRDNKNFRF